MPPDHASAFALSSARNLADQMFSRARSVPELESRIHAALAKGGFVSVE
jgi:hypothetical protein